jgi:hypothetical protein
MTCRAIIWCGFIKKSLGVVEANIFRNDIELAIAAALQRHVRPQDVCALVCDPSLLPQAFSGQVLPATLESLEAVTNSIAQVATPDDCLLWIATNHGDRDGLLIETEPLDEFAEDDAPRFLSPDLLARYLDPLPGNQIGIIATCYAGIFSPLANQRRAMFAACGPRDVYIVDYGDLHPPRSPFLYEMLSHWAGVSLGNYAAPARRSILEAFGVVEPDFQGCGSAGDASWPD